MGQKYLSRDELNNIESAITKAEKSTSGEIVLAIADNSDLYQHGVMIWGFIVSLIALVAANYYLLPLMPQHHLAQSSTLVGVAVLGFICGSFIVRICPSLRLFFIHKDEMARRVEEQTCRAFFNFDVSKTRGDTGIIILVSMLEHMVHVHGDSAISDKLSELDWANICNTITAGIKRGKLADGLSEAVAKSGELLAKHFPASSDNPNELPNKVRFI